MTTIRVKHNHSALFGMPIQTNNGNVPLTSVSGYSAVVATSLHGYQQFMQKIDSAISANGITHLLPLECAEQFAQNYLPDDINAFAAKTYGFNFGGSDFRSYVPMWTRYYKFQPVGVATPLYLKFEGGIIGASSNTTNRHPAPYMRVAFSYSFNSVTGFDSELASHWFSKFATYDGYFNSGSITISNSLYAYITDDNFYIVPFNQRYIADTNAYLYFGKTANFTFPENLPIGLICTKAIAHVPGMGNVTEAIALTGDRFGGATIGVDSSNNNLMSITAAPETPASIITNVGGEVRCPFSFSTSAVVTQTPSRMLTCPFTYVTSSGVVYQAPSLLYLSDPVRNILAVRDYTVNVQGVIRRVLVTPLLQHTVRSTSSQATNAVTLGVILDDTVINA